MKPLHPVELMRMRRETFDEAVAFRKTISDKSGRPMNREEREEYFQLVELFDDISEQGSEHFVHPLTQFNPTASMSNSEIARREKEVFDQYETEQIVDKPPRGNVTYVGRPGKTAAGLKTAGSGHKYSEMFGAATSNGGFPSFDEFLSAVASGRHHPNLTPMTALGMVESIPASGGFLVPDQFAEMLLNASLENEIVRPRATVYPMESANINVPMWAGDDHTSNLSGFQARWMAEEGTAVEDTGTLKMLELIAEKLAVFTKASSELVSDGQNFEMQLAKKLTQVLGWHLDYAFLQGSGAGRPQGILNAASLITISKETGQAAATIVYENLTKMYARLHPECQRNAVWVANSNCVPQLLQLGISVGTGGDHYQVMNEKDGKFSIFGLPVIFTEKLPTLGTTGDLLLVSCDQYLIGMRKQISIDRSIHAGWSTDQVAFRTIVRATGRPSWTAAITPKAGDTLSWAVVIETRS